MKIRVYHAYYGCDTGCCGHIVEVDGKDRFEFDHPGTGLTREQHLSWAVEFAKGVVKEFFPECLETIDWDSIEIEVDAW